MLPFESDTPLLNQKRPDRIGDSIVSNRKLDHATRLYMEGIRDGNVRHAVETHTGDRYTQHSTGVADGVEGFVAFFEPFMERNPVRDIQVTGRSSTVRMCSCTFTRTSTTERPDG